MKIGRQQPKLRVGLAVLAAVIAAMWAAASVAWAVGADPAPTAESGSASHDSSGAALYNGRLIDLATDWEGAGACVVWPDQLAVIECFDDEKQLEERVARVENATATGMASMSLGGSGAAAASSGCSTFMKLYDYTNYGGSSVWISTRLSWHNLSNYGFDQRVSSFKIGACSAYFADLAWGGGAWYPTYLTQAYDQSSSMLSGWNNDLSSVYIR